ncbi:Ribosomal L37ae protein [Rutstroemia sp. NJR-2017a BBW]|nr:Ribosomal L37ae protein [Rutstroemia sp. NJR-2017a BBW]
MTDACIVCLEDLDTIPHAGDEEKVAGAVPITTITTNPGKHCDDDLVAQIKPCGHVLHDHCLREWSQKANSCPICRSSFNLVEVLDRVGGIILQEYTVEDKKQVAEFDLAAWQDENPEDEEEEARPCPVCDLADQEDVLLLCDGCETPYHTHCIGLDRVPAGLWYCMECVDSGAFSMPIDLEDMPARMVLPPRFTRTQANVRRQRNLFRRDRWINAWGQFSSTIDQVAGVDLDFSEDDPHMRSYRDHQRRTAEQSREFERWEQRLRIASRQGASRAFRAAAPPVIRQRTVERVEPPAPVETPEERQAWGAFERAKDLDNTPNQRKRKSRSGSSSPAGPSTAEEPERKQKRPRTRMVQNGSASSAPSVAASSNRQPSMTEALSRPSPQPSTSTTNSEPTLIMSLLREVEATPSSDDDISRMGFDFGPSRTNGATSPSLDYSSPAASPSSPASSPRGRAMSITPPPRSRQSASPLPLSSSIIPNFALADYSPNRSPPDPSLQRNSNRDASPTPEIRQPQPRRRPVSARSQEPSPTRSEFSSNEDVTPMRATMSIEEKENISRLVKAALGPHWKSQKLTKEQYANINQTVSRRLYELVADKEGIFDREKSSWEKIATTEVGKAVESLTV